MAVDALCTRCNRPFRWESGSVMECINCKYTPDPAVIRITPTDEGWYCEDMTAYSPSQSLREEMDG